MTTMLCETNQDYELRHENDTFDVLTGRVAICKDYGDKGNKIAFGEYLLYEGKIDAYELELALEYQKHEHHTIGLLAVQEGFLNDRQLCVILDYQRLRGTGLFGELAVELGLLNQDDIDTLLEMQKQEDSHIRIGEVLILLGAITRKEMEEALNEFSV